MGRRYEFLQMPALSRCGCRLYRETDDWNRVKSGETGHIKNKYGHCLTAGEQGTNTKWYGKVSMEPCEEGNKNQRWKWDPKHGWLKDVRGNCLSTPKEKKSGGKVVMNGCTQEGVRFHSLLPHRQRWRISPKTSDKRSTYYVEIKDSRSGGLCLEGEKNKDGG